MGGRLGKMPDWVSNWDWDWESPNTDATGAEGSASMCVLCPCCEDCLPSISNGNRMEWDGGQSSVDKQDLISLSNVITS